MMNSIYFFKDHKFIIVKKKVELNYETYNSFFFSQAHEKTFFCFTNYDMKKETVFLL